VRERRAVIFGLGRALFEALDPAKRGSGDLHFYFSFCFKWLGPSKRLLIYFGENLAISRLQIDLTKRGQRKSPSEILTLEGKIMNEAQRREEIQRFGESVVLEHLIKQGYKGNLLRKNHRCFDISAYRDGQQFPFSVKARNHTTHTGEEKKDDYNLLHGKGRVEEAYQIAKQGNAIPMWATVRVNAINKVYDGYWGRIDKLRNPKSVPMKAADRKRHDKFGENIADERIKEGWTNVKPTGGPSGHPETEARI